MDQIGTVRHDVVSNFGLWMSFGNIFTSTTNHIRNGKI